MSESQTGKQAFTQLLNLQLITEKLLYSMSIPEEIAKKYNILKQQTYSQIGLDPVNTIISIDKIFWHVEEPAPSILLENAVVSNFYEYLRDLTHALQAEDQLLPTFNSVATNNSKLNEIQMEFSSKSQSMVHCLASIQKMQETQRHDYQQLRQKFDQECQQNVHLEAQIRSNQMSTAQDHDAPQFMELVRDRILKAVQSRHPSYFKTYLSEKGLTKPGQMFDPVDLALYVSQRLQGDNDWLVDKLAELESLRTSQQSKIDHLVEKQAQPLVSRQTIAASMALLSNLEEARDDLVSNIRQPYHQEEVADQRMEFSFVAESEDNLADRVLKQQSQASFPKTSPSKSVQESDPPLPTPLMTSAAESSQHPLAQSHGTRTYDQPLTMNSLYYSSGRSEADKSRSPRHMRETQSSQQKRKDEKSKRKETIKSLYMAKQQQ